MKNKVVNLACKELACLRLWLGAEIRRKDIATRLYILQAYMCRVIKKLRGNETLWPPVRRCVCYNAVGFLSIIYIHSHTIAICKSITPSPCREAPCVYYVHKLHVSIVF